MTDEYHKWQDLYPSAASRWQDLVRIAKFMLPAVFTIFFLATYMIVHIFIYIDNWFQESSTRYWEYLIIFRFLAIILPSTTIIIIGVSFLYKQMKGFIVSFYQPNPDEKLTHHIRRKLFGIPPLPPILDTFINYPFIVLREPVLDENHWSRWFGGPAILVIYDGIAVYLERGNKFSRIVGPGLPSLERHERVNGVVDLRPQTKIDYTRPWTKDGIRIKLTIRAEIQIHASQEAIKNSFKLRFPFDPVAVKKAMEYTSVKSVDGKLVESPWLDGAWGSITGSVNKFVAGHSLDELFLAPEIENHTNSNHQENQTLESIEQLLSGQISKHVTSEIQDSLQKHGINLLDLQITSVEMPEKVRALRTRYWESIRKKIAARRDSRAEADRIRAREQAHADAQRTMLTAIINRLRAEGTDSKKMTEHLILSLSGILDQGQDDPIIRPLIAKEAIAVLERIKKLLEEGF